MVTAFTESSAVITVTSAKSATLLAYVFADFAAAFAGGLAERLWAMASVLAMFYLSYLLNVLRHA